MTTAPTKKTVITEGAQIYCELRGNGPLLLLITGAMGDAGFYSPTAELLAARFTVVCYDRRCSSGDRTSNMRVGQQARDVTSIIKAMGTDKAFIFGSSGGGIIGLKLAAAMPEVIDFLIVDEAPVTELLPETGAEKWRSFHHDIFVKSQLDGWMSALPEFMASLINVPDTPYPSNLNERISGNMDCYFNIE